MSNNIKTRDELTISDNKEKSLKNFILEWSEIIFKVGLIVGSIIAFCFYFFYVGYLGTFGKNATKKFKDSLSFISQVPF